MKVLNTYVVPLVHPQFLNVVEGFSTLLTEAFVLISVDFVLENAALLEHLFHSLAFFQLTDDQFLYLT